MTESQTSAAESLSPTDYRSFAYGMILHQRMLAGDPGALEIILYQLMAPLVRGVARKFPGYFDTVQYEAAAEESIFSYWQKPQRYNPELKLALYGFLLMAAKRDFQNLWDKDKRQMGGEPSRLHATRVEVEEEMPEVEYVDSRIVANDDKLILLESSVWSDIAGELPDPRDQECAYLMLEGVRERMDYVLVFGISDLPPKEQEHVVKKHKDRIKKQLQRHLVREEYKLHD